MGYNLEKFLSGLHELDIELSEKQMEQFLTYYELLTEKNKVMNLTAITDFEEVIEKHFLDSLSLVKAVCFGGTDKPEGEAEEKRFSEEKKRKTINFENRNVSLLDLGTGAGFPGIPLKIAFPGLDVVLMDSLNKRILFLQEAIEKLQLKGITAVHGRAEEMARKKEYREHFDLCVSRAVANLSSLSEYCVPFVKVGGCFVSYKSGDVEEELKESEKAVKVLGSCIKEVVKFRLPNTEMGRSLVIIEKLRATPKAYPRKAGTPSKNPIK